MNLRTAIIGMGKMGRIRLRELQANKNFSVTHICDVDEQVGKEFPDLKFNSNWQDIIKADLDVVIVCTFNHIAPDIVCKALQNGLHVFCEKPPGRTVADVQRIIEAEKAAGDRIVKFGFNHRLHYAIIEAKSIVDSGKFGEVLWARGIYGKAGDLRFENSWRTDPKLAGGGILLDQGIHMLDLMRYFVGDFVDVKSFIGNSYWKDAGNEDNAFALLRTAKNQVAMLHSSATQWKHKFSLDLFMEDGYILLNGILSSTRSYGEESITFARKQFEDTASAFGKPREETIYFDRDDSWTLEIEELYDTIAGKQALTTGTTKDALKVMMLIEDIYRDAGSNKNS